MARSTRSTRSSSRSLPLPDSDEEHVVRPYVPPARLESSFGTDRMAAALSLQQPQQQHQTREQRASAAEQAQVLAAAALRRSAAARANNRSAFSNNGNNDSTGIDDDDSGSNGTFSAFNCCNSLRNSGAHSAIQPVSSDIIDYRFRWRIRRMQDHYITTPLSSPPSYCYGLRIGSSKPSPAQ